MATMHNSGVLMMLIIFGSAAVTSIGVPLARAYARRLDRGVPTPAPQPEITARLERMEQAIDSIAIEVERISEGQRFTTKLLSERTGGQARVPSIGDRPS
jgi:hypothetical protein